MWAKQEMVSRSLAKVLKSCSEPSHHNADCQTYYKVCVPTVSPTVAPTDTPTVSPTVPPTDTPTKLPTKMVVRPTAAGCWVMTPSGCPNQQNFNAQSWQRDTWGEQNRQAAEIESQCLTTRKVEFDNWCGASDTIVSWNPPPTVPPTRA
eukprot:gene57612-biopygen115917